MFSSRPAHQRHRVTRGLGILFVILSLVHAPLPEPDFHNIRHHDRPGEVCDHHDHLLRWHPRRRLGPRRVGAALALVPPGLGSVRRGTLPTTGAALHARHFATGLPRPGTTPLGSSTGHDVASTSRTMFPHLALPALPLDLDPAAVPRPAGGPRHQRPPPRRLATSAAASTKPSSAHRYAC